MNFIEPPVNTEALKAKIEACINEGIVKSHAEGKNFFKTYGPNGIFGGGNLYTTEDKYPEVVKETLKGLREKGFKARICAVENQFVDIFLLIEW